MYKRTYEIVISADDDMEFSIDFYDPENGGQEHLDFVYDPEDHSFMDEIVGNIIHYWVSDVVELTMH